MPYPFQNFSLKDLLELSNRVGIRECNQGHSSDMFVNGKLVNDRYDSIYVSLLSYIKFLGEQIEQYFLNAYQMKILGFKYPNVYSYINILMSDVQECVRVKAENGNRPWPRDVIDYLGQDDVEKYAHMLYSIIDLLLKENGLKIGSGSDHYEDLEKVEKIETDLSEASDRLLKLLQVTDAEIKERTLKRFETFSIDEVNLETYLSENIDVNKIPVLKKNSKNT